MQIYTSYNEAFQAALSSQTFSVAQLQHIKQPINIDTSCCYKLFFLISGSKLFHIDHFMYDVQPGDLFFINQREFHYFSHISGSDSHERIVIFIYPEFLRALCTPKTDLCTCFSHKTGQPEHRLRLQTKDRDKLAYLIHKLTSIRGYGEDVLTRSFFVELMVFANSIYQSCRAVQAEIAPAHAADAVSGYSAQVRPITTYIDSHITEDLSLDILSSHFYLTPSYLCRLFKNGTGTTIHKYITAKRITLAKDMLTQGFSVADTCKLSGFKDYNGFFKSFVSAVGISPKKYAQFGEP